MKRKALNRCLASLSFLFNFWALPAWAGRAFGFNLLPFGTKVFSLQSLTRPKRCTKQ